MVDLKNVCVAYNKGHNVINGIDIHIDDGDFTFIVGASGAGKSTLIKLLLKEVDACDGTVMVNGFNLRTLKKNRVPKFRRTIGVVFQDFRLIPSMTVYDNIAFVLRVINAPRSYIKKRVSYVIGLVGLQNKMKSYPNELSGGEQQRVALARALVNDPKLLIADEPTGNVDPELSQEIVGLLKAINACGTTVVMVTHEHELVKHFGGRLININQGTVIYDDIIDGEAESVNDESI